MLLHLLPLVLFHLLHLVLLHLLQLVLINVPHFQKELTLELINQEVSTKDVLIVMV